MGSNKAEAQLRATVYLRRETAGIHAQTEAVALAREIMDQSLNPEQYRNLIDKNRFLHQSLEPLFRKGLVQYQLNEFLPFLHPRLEAIQADVELLQLPASSYPISPPDLTSPTQLLGGLYVLLGSNLGGRVIYRSLKENPQLQTIPEFHFYGSSDQVPAREWPQFCRRLDQAIQSEAELRAAGYGAEKVFRFVKNVFEA